MQTMTTKTCTRCGETKPTGEYGKRKDRPSGLKSECKACHIQESIEWNKIHPKEVAEASKRHLKRHPEKYTARNAARKAAKIQATPIWADQAAIESIYAESRRLTEETGILHHVDHIVPLRGRNVSGLHVEFNLRAIPAVENQRKSNHYA